MSTLKEKYLEALRSGEYNQIRTQLTGKDDDGNCGHCALGVLAVVAGIEISEDGIELMSEYGKEGYEPLNNIIGTDKVNRIWTFNDVDKLTFAEIAEYVEEEVEFPNV